MNTSALKSFAPAVRRQLMEAVERKLDVVLAAESADYRTTYARQVKALAALAAADRQGLVDRVAYTWFNRLAALRYLDARGWHPFRSRVLTAASPEETQPEVLRRMRTGALPDDLARHTDPARLDGFLDGSIPSTTPQGEVYRHLVLAACRYYHALLPDLFERLDDETELLLPDDLLTEQSVVEGFRTQIADEDCAEVEVLGWLYQFYISEKKDEVMGRKKAVPSEDIPAVTQLFTPHWIVRYLVENSLGRLWLLNRPGSALRDQMPYYVEGEAETDFLRIETPQEIKLIDPAVGSGHMLTYAFDLLFAIYEEEGYAPSEIPGLILTHNLYGVDIDPRAAQLASLALVLKAREKARRFFSADALVRPHVIALQDVAFSERELDDYVRALDLGGLFDGPVRELLGQFEHATTFGSLIQPVLGEADIRQLRERIEAKGVGGELFLSETHHKVLRVLEQAEVLTQRYQVAVANPPYMSSSSFTSKLKSFSENTYVSGRTDMFELFIWRLGCLVEIDGFASMITLHNWMFIKSYEELRRHFLTKWTTVTLAHFGPRAFDTISGEIVQTCAFVICTSGTMRGSGDFIRVVKGRSEAEKDRDLISAINDKASPLRYRMANETMLSVPSHPIAYWVDKEVINTFSSGHRLEDIAPVRQGFQTGDNDRFMRAWSEVSKSRFKTDAHSKEDVFKSSKKWVPYNKGGSFRRWYGNNEYIVAFDKSSYEQLLISGNKLPSRRLYFKEAVTWSALASGELGARYSPSGFTFSAKGACAFPEPESLHIALGLLNSAFASKVFEFYAATLDFNVGSIRNVPVLPKNLYHFDRITSVVDQLILLARRDWDYFESSWDFTCSPLLAHPLKGNSIEESWARWSSQCDTAISKAQALEEENNRLFTKAYGLVGKLFSEVPEDQITLARADKRDDVAAFLSYAVGCMMGRYSLDTPGLVLADAGATVEDYLEKVGVPLGELTFAPDDDGIVPLLDGEWFEDDVVARTRDFLRATFGEDTLTENLRFIEEALGRDLRSYFLRDFYTDHLKTYKNRPIYWLVQSPKKGFGALVYLHRYTRDTLNLVLNRYLREYQAKLRDRIAHLARVQADDSVPTRERTAARKEHDKLVKTLHECEEWERETVLPLAQARIELDLDDGVKANYPKLGKALATVSGLS